MFFWWLVVGVLVASLAVLFLLLAPLPTFLHAATVSLLDVVYRPLWLVLAVLSWVLFDATMEMNKHESDEARHNVGPVGVGTVQYNQRWRAERNFYLTAFCWSLLLVVLRCHHLARSRINLWRENQRLRALRQNR